MGVVVTGHLGLWVWDSNVEVRIAIGLQSCYWYMPGREVVYKDVVCDVKCIVLLLSAVDHYTNRTQRLLVPLFQLEKTPEFKSENFAANTRIRPCGLSGEKLAILPLRHRSSLVHLNLMFRQKRA